MGVPSIRQLIAATAVGALCFVTSVSQTIAAGLLRDPDIEYALSRLALPVLNAAGLSGSQVDILLVDDDGLNAFVVDASHIFITSGLLMRLQSAPAVQSVFSHEAAHIANGHLTRRFTNRGNANTAAGLGVLLALAAAAAGADGKAVGGIAIGTASSAQRVFLAHTRAEEASADQSGARFLSAAGIDPNSYVDVLNIFRGQEALSAVRQDPYMRSHPLTNDRIRAMKGYAAAFPAQGTPDAASEYWFQRARTKLSAFKRNPSWTLRQYKKNDKSELAELGRAIAYHKRADLAQAEAAMTTVLAKRPNDPFYLELLGQIRFENRDFDGAVSAYRAAHNAAPRHGLILAGYGRSLLTANTTSGNAQALKVLQQAYARDPRAPRMLRDLAMAYARAGQNGMASVTTAERYALSGRLSDAAIHAKRALATLPAGTSAARRADDILRAAPATKRK